MEPRKNPLARPMQYIKGVGPRLASLFSKKGIDTVEDALYFLPRAYEDRRKILPIAGLLPETPATVFGTVVSKAQPRHGNRSRVEAVVADETGKLVLVWFHTHPAITEDFGLGKQMLIHGSVSYYGGHPQIVHPEYEKISKTIDGKPIASQNFGRVVPIYSETEGLHQKTIRRIMAEVLRASLSHLGDPLPLDLRLRLGLPNLRESFASVHFPNEFPRNGPHTPAVRRIIFEEFFILQLGLGLKKKQRESQRAVPMEDPGDLASTFIASLPFQLTTDQRTVFEEIRRDLKRSIPMTRLVQGDVGSGKTVVALAAGALAAGSGFQTALMVPTEILAQQHFQVAEKYVKPLGIQVALVVHGNASKRSLREAIATGKIQCIVGTHALFQESFPFKNLGLVIVDEQHRFGVEQRALLIRKGASSLPHLLMMTATPIPRTLAMTLYGDLDISLIREKPVGRQKIKTTLLRGKDRFRLYQRIRSGIGGGEQAYIIYPLIEPSEKLELKSATEMYDHLRLEVFPQFRLSLLHGRMKTEEKEKTLAEFKEGKSQILVSTTVIEVGIDVANATLMVIEHPERLGLSQLHQLRGRVGRGHRSSECILVAETFVTDRLRVIEKTDDGFEIAEEDLKIRGPGEFLGTRQHGLPGFRVGHILRDASLLSVARQEAMAILTKDPELILPEHAGIRVMVESRWREKIERLRGG